MGHGGAFGVLVFWVPLVTCAGYVMMFSWCRYTSLANNPWLPLNHKCCVFR